MCARVCIQKFTFTYWLIKELESKSNTTLILVLVLILYFYSLFPIYDKFICVCTSYIGYSLSYLQQIYVCTVGEKYTNFIRSTKNLYTYMCESYNPRRFVCFASVLRWNKFQMIIFALYHPVLNFKNIIVPSLPKSLFIVNFKIFMSKKGIIELFGLERVNILTNFEIFSYFWH